MPTKRILVLVLAVVSLAAAACGDDGGTTTTAVTATTGSTVRGQTVEPGTFEPATTGPLLEWYETAGECQTCGFSITFDASGTAVYEGHRTRATVAFDVDDLVGRLERIDHQPLTDGRDDCGREVDGNAPVLDVYPASGGTRTIDDCYTPIDRDHPVMAFVLATLAEARGAEAATLVEVFDVGGRCPDGVCRSGVQFYDDGTAIRLDDDGTTAEASIAADDLEELRRLVAAADGNALVLGPFTGTCPTEADGQERTYSIGGDEEREPIRLASCRDELDHDSPLLALVDRLVADAVSG